MLLCRYSSCSDSVVYIHDISKVKENGSMESVLSFAVPNIGHILSLNVMCVLPACLRCCDCRMRVW